MRLLVKKKRRKKCIRKLSFSSCFGSNYVGLNRTSSTPIFGLGQGYWFFPFKLQLHSRWSYYLVEAVDGNQSLFYTKVNPYKGYRMCRPLHRSAIQKWEGVKNHWAVPFCVLVRTGRQHLILSKLWNTMQTWTCFCYLWCLIGTSWATTYHGKIILLCPMLKHEIITKSLFGQTQL